MYVAPEHIRAVSPWLARFLGARELSHPDGRSLFRYRCSAEEFDQLAQECRRLLRTENANLLWPGALLCLFVAEWWRRCYGGGPWKYGPALERLGVDLVSRRRDELVELGLEFWRRPLRGTSRREFFGSLAVEGGLPVVLLQGGPSSQIGTFLRSITDRLRALDSARLEALLNDADAMLQRVDHIPLPRTLDHRPVRLLGAELAGRLLQLHRDLNARERAEGVAAAHDEVLDAWRARLPIDLDQEDARALVRELLGREAQLSRPVAAAVRPSIAWRLHLVRCRGGTWAHVRRLAVEGLRDCDVAAMLDVQTLPVRRRVQLYAGAAFVGELVPAAGDIWAWQAYEPVPTTAWERSTRVHCTAPGVPRVATAWELPAAEPDPAVPWLFTEDEEGLVLAGQGACGVSAPRVLLSVPAGAEVRAEGGARVQRVSPDLDAATVPTLDEGRRWWRVEGFCAVHHGDERWRCGTRSGATAYEAPRFNGTMLEHETSRAPVYIGFPALEPAGGWQPEIQRPSAIGAALNGVWGKLRVRIRDAHGWLASVQTLKVAPPDLRVHFRPVGEGGGELAVECPSQVIDRVEGKAMPHSTEYVPLYRHDRARFIHVWPPGTWEDGVSRQVRLRLLGRVHEELELSLSFDDVHPILLGPHGRPVADQALAVHELRAYRLVAAPRAGQRLEVQLSADAGGESIGLRHRSRPAAGNQSRVEVPLGELVAPVQRLLASTEAGMDARVRLSARCGDEPITRYWTIARFRSVLAPDASRHLAVIEPKPTGGERLSGTAFRLDAPETCRELTPPPGEALDGAWEVPSDLDAGPWLLAVRDAAGWCTHRPLLWTVRGEQRTTVTGALAAASREEDPRIREGALRRRLLVLMEDDDRAADADWRYLDDICERMAALPPGSIDAGRILVEAPVTAVALLLTRGSTEMQEVLRNEGLDWCLLSARTAADGIHAAWRILHRRANEAPPSLVVREYIEPFVDRYQRFRTSIPALDTAVRAWCKAGASQPRRWGREPAPARWVRALEGALPGPCAERVPQRDTANAIVPLRWGEREHQAAELIRWLRHQLRTNAPALRNLPEPRRSAPVLEDLPQAVAVALYYDLLAGLPLPRRLFLLDERGWLPDDADLFDAEVRRALDALPSFSFPWSRSRDR